MLFIGRIKKSFMTLMVGNIDSEQQVKSKFGLLLQYYIEYYMLIEHYTKAHV